MSRHHRRLSQRRLAIFRREVLDAASWCCQRCGVPAGEDLEAHHVQPIEAGGEPYDARNGRAMCRNCHMEIHEADPARLAWRRYVRQTGITR